MQTNKNFWQLLPLSKIASASSNSFVDGPFGSNLKSDEYTTEGVRLIQLQNIGDGEWIDDNKIFTSEKKYQELKRHAAFPGDIAIAKMADPIARACIIPPVSNRFLVVADCIKLTPDLKKYHPKFIVYAINNHSVRLQAELKSTGTTRKRINLSLLKTVNVEIPPIHEQRRIAEILDTIDEAIQKTEALISKLKTMKQGLLHDLLTCGLDENGKLRDQKAHLIPFSDVVQVNPTTDLYGLNDKTNVSFIPMSDVSESGQWVIRQARSFKDVRNGYTCFKENDVLFAKITPCMENGKGSHAIGLVNGIGFGTTEFHVLRASAEIEPRYIYYWTMTEGLRRKAEAQMTGSAGQRRVPAEFFDNFKIPLFSRSEQRKIVKILDAHDVRIRTEEQYRDKLKLQKKGLMHDLLTGKVRVRV